MQARRLQQGTDGRLRPRRLRDHGVTAGRSAVSRWGLLVVLTVAFVSVAHGRVGAYKFYSDGDRENCIVGSEETVRGPRRCDDTRWALFGRIVGSEEAARWSPDVWGPGDTLVWEIAPDPEFEVYFDAWQGVLPLIEQALAAWSDPLSAAISWRVVLGGDEVDGVGKRDGRNTIYWTDGAWAADLWWDRSSTNRWELRECDVSLGNEWVDIPEGEDPKDYERRRQSLQTPAFGGLVHHFGHCLGLTHAGALSVVEGRGVSRFGSRRWVHPHDTVMSYGSWWRSDEAGYVTHDDVVGASLLRPADGWKRGSISGVLDLPGEEAARYAHVWALPVDGDPLRDRVGAFTNRDGAFLIEGLRPGNYALWAQPMMIPIGQFVENLTEDPVFDLQDTVLGRPVRVRAGGTTGGVEIPVRRGRKGRPPPEAMRTPRHSDPGTPINNRWGSTCSGVRIRGEPPFAADGPLWFTQGDWRLRGERWFATRLTVEWSPEAGNAVFDWAGPWRDWYWDGAQAKSFWGGPPLYLDISISNYQIEASGPVTRHTMEIAWPETTEARLRFRSGDGACEGEPTVVCNLAGCGITR